MKVDAKLVHFFQKNKFCLLKIEKNCFFRVRDWKGYGIWYKCGTCEPMQNPTSSSRMTSDTMDDEEGGADAPRQGRNTNRASMHDAGTRETAGIKCRGKEERNRYHVLT